eukprot:GHVU01084206.1.p3 GENE.GHVU01084206.1~~GHVU01084206.1.p3  ORF type:complete len:235 (+),score=23.99 GHVU01084206.1:2256-2960(+)
MCRITDSDWDTLVKVNNLLNRCHLLGGGAAVETKANITSRLSQYRQTLAELTTAANNTNIQDMEVAAFARSARDRMVSDEASYLSDAVLDGNALSPRTVVTPEVRQRLVDMVARMPGDPEVETPEVVTRELASWCFRRPLCADNVCELEWFRRHEADFPVVSRMARRVLTVNSTSVECERMFSIAGNILAPRRTRMVDETVENLVEYRAWGEYTAHSRRLHRQEEAGGEMYETA